MEAGLQGSIEFFKGISMNWERVTPDIIRLIRDTEGMISCIVYCALSYASHKP